VRRTRPSVLLGLAKSLLRVCVVTILLVGGSLLGAAGRAAVPPGVASSDRRPDLVEAVPLSPHVVTLRTGRHVRSLLTFGSAVLNRGSGALVLVGRRHNSAVPTMEVEQLIASSHGFAHRALRAILRFDGAHGHHHWHLQGFESYSLYAADGIRRLRGDHKVGFCVRDDVSTDPLRALPGQPSDPVFRGRCGLNQPWRLSVREGLSVGFTDAYPPTVAGQWIDISGLPSGTYTLAAAVNPSQSIAETNYANDTSSVLIRITDPSPTLRATPSVAVLRRCAFQKHC
jgi:hypothetical protein